MQANLLVREPTKPTEGKQLPLVTAHSNVLDGPINHFCFAYYIEIRPDALAIRGWDSSENKMKAASPTEEEIERTIIGGVMA